MAGFHDLPDELLLEIIPCLALPSILPFALLNRRAHGLCQPTLSRSQALHRKWGRVCISLAWSADLAMLVDVLLRDPDLSWYVRELDTCLGDADAWAFDAFGLDADENGWEVCLPRVQSRVRASARLEEAARREWLKALRQAGGRSLTLSATLLLSLLPELRALVMAEQADVVLPWLQTSPLASKLRRLRCNMSHAMVPWLQLPALTELVVEETRSTEETTVSTLPVGVCPLTKVELIRSSLSPHNLGVIFQMVKREGPHGGLQTFIYSHRDHVTRPGYHIFHGPGLIESLLMYSRQSLLELDLDVIRIHYRDHHEMDRLGHFWYEDNVTALGRGLKQFERLEMLKVSIEMLVEGWHISDEESDDDELGDGESDDGELGDDELGNDEPDGESGIEMAMQLPLWEVLPQSLQVLDICSKGYMQSTAVVTEKLVALFHEGPDAVPRLRELLIDWQLFEPWKGLLEGYCKKRGVHFEYEQPSLL